mmetsp:Transcript_1337/g.1373  ORF Transcript_1337/g.1373 Transcript_1337/m.1373 type:complete len:82 (+) Transcript_1337:574-819(+)
MITGLSCHPSKSVFVTCSDDTLVCLFEVTGDSLDKIDINLIISSRVNDYLLTGVCFGGEGNNSVLTLPYDFKVGAVWSNIV